MSRENRSAFVSPSVAARDGSAVASDADNVMPYGFSVSGT